MTEEEKKLIARFAVFWHQVHAVRCRECECDIGEAYSTHHEAEQAALRYVREDRKQVVCDDCVTALARHKAREAKKNNQPTE